MSTFTVGINKKVVGKCDADMLSYAKAWIAGKLTLTQLAEHIGAGHPWMPALLDAGQRRYQRYSNHAEVLALDIDSGMTIAQAIANPVVSRHCGLGIESASSTSEHNKFRLVFVLPRAVEGHATIRICNQYLAYIVGSADRACKDASRYFFGAPGREPFLLNDVAKLPASFVEDAIAWYEAAVAKAEAEAEANRRRWAEMPKSQSGDVVRDALSCVRPYAPGEGRYADLIPMIGGVLNEYGPEGEQMLREWDGGRGDWGRGGFDRILDSVRTSQPTRKATLGTLFYLAKQEGFRFPKQARGAVKRGGKAAPITNAQTTNTSGDGDKPETGATRRTREKWQAVEKEYGLSLPVDEFEDQYTEARALAEIERIKAEVQAIYEPGQVVPDRIIINGQNGFSEADLAALLQVDAPTVGTGNTGCGKTQLAVALDEYMGHPSLAGEASTQNLSIGQADRLGTTSTASGKTVPIDWARVSMPAESVYKIGSRTPELLIVDEPDALLPRLLEGSLGDAQDANLSTQRRLAKSVKTQLWLNANMSPVTIDAIAHLSGKQPYIVEIQRDYGAAFHPEDVEVQIYTDDDEGNSGKYPWLAALFQAAKAGQTLLVLEPSVQMAKTIKRMAIARGISCTLRDGTFSTIDQRRGFAFNPDQVCAKRQITIVTRLAETGADIKAKPDAVFVRLSPNQTSEQGYQFLSRARKLLTGEIPQLHIHPPSLTFSGPEQVSVAWQLERIKAANAYKVELLKTAAKGNRAQLAEVQNRIDELEAEFTLLARYKAEDAAQRIFRSEYLLKRLAQVGFNVDPSEAITGNSDATDRWESQVAKHKRRNDETKAACIARGHRHLGEYTPDYQDKIGDIREQGFILGCKRKKLDLAARFPLSPLENPDWILSQVIDNERAEPQTLVLGILLLTKDPAARAALQQHRAHLADSAIAVGNQYGPLTLIRKLAHRIDLAALDIAALLSQSELVQAIVDGTLGEFCKADAAVQELAALLRANEQRLSVFCRLYLDHEMSWSEKSDTALVCKALNKLLGLPTAKTTQKRVNGKPCHFYELGNTDTAIAVRVEKIVAKSHGMADPDDVRPQLLEAWGKHWAMAESAAEGWCQSAGATREATAEPPLEPCHTKSKTLEPGTGFSVTPPPPEISPGDWAELQEMVAWAQQAGADALNDLAATLAPQVGRETWEVLVNV
ncbi:hypothetical protein ACQ4N7_28460 [Nodosilinea sp. AN01ver1]|uniref:hypothetical protein n=1 Tax=Nodosilinea sp. AN01ver1 TaxID=3423362 RepID=UPI003D31F093